MTVLAGSKRACAAAIVAGFWSFAGPKPSEHAPVETFELRSEVFHNSRSIRVLLPQGYRDPANRNRRYPVLYLNDGFAVFKASAWNAPEIVERLESEGRMQPIILVGMDNGASIENGSAEQRTREYLPYPDPKNEPSVPSPQGASYPEFLIKEVMTAVSVRYRVMPGAENTGIGGASYGGLAALYTVIHSPDTFGRLLLESTPLFLADFAALKEAKTARRWPARISIGIGTKETDDEALASAAASNMEALRAAILRASPRSDVKLVVEPEGTHGSPAWRRRLPGALKFLWPPPTLPRQPPAGSGIDAWPKTYLQPAAVRTYVSLNQSL